MTASGRSGRAGFEPARVAATWIGAASIALALVWPPAPAHAQYTPICLVEFESFLAKLEVKVPLGCELIDCCPRCPAGGRLDWDVRVDGGLGSAEIRIGTDGEPTRLPAGESRLVGVGHSGADGSAAVARLRLAADLDVLARWRRLAAGTDGSAYLGSILLEVDQLLGDVVVNELVAKWDVVSCNKPKACDQIVQTSNDGDDSSVLLLDGRRSAGCFDDEIRRESGAERVGNLLPAASCPSKSEVGVFSTDDAMMFQEDVQVWTNECDDVLTIALPDPWKMPANFFLALGWPGPEPILDVATEDLKNANQLYNENKTGIQFELKNHPLDPGQWLKLLLGLGKAVIDLLKDPLNPISAVCGLPTSMEQAGLYVGGEINVYYINLPFAGMICEDDRNVIFIGSKRKKATLAHEFGHSLSLLGKGGHTNGVAGFDAENIMWVGDPTPRTHFSLGQAFRHNLHPLSTLNANNVRTGVKRACPLLPPAGGPDPDPSCPRLETDWTRP